ncbi:hypothetical protein FRX31_034881 [Thalictrum thalictroides]|uniref:Uncharacterized protein n=1 Tax=Thalictrum thalictroides TaxID=46969 RepID=A0A7J6UTG4_THATH|nr:hypothetical protein FRX31_034881 [Thalictrum thalictroides]
MSSIVRKLSILIRISREIWTNSKNVLKVISNPSFIPPPEQSWVVPATAIANIGSLLLGVYSYVEDKEKPTAAAVKKGVAAVKKAEECYRSCPCYFGHESLCLCY